MKFFLIPWFTRQDRNYVFLFTAFLFLGLAAAPAAQAKTKAAPTPTPEASDAGDTDETSPADLSQMSLEKLADLDVQVTSASKKPESLRAATSAIYVITAEDIRRSGARTLPDLLIMVPGVQVARQSANEWAISARGFNAQYNNKMLVLIDGRSVYDPAYGGVNWNEQDVFLADIDHIEVIRGPGGTLWGSNAVNGIINVITKDAKATQGSFFSASVGDHFYPGGIDPKLLDSLVATRWGGKFSDSLYYRFYGQFSSRGPSLNPKTDLYEAALGDTWNDDWYDFRLGLRADWHSDQDQVTVEAGAQKGYFRYARLTTAVDYFFDPKTFLAGNDLNTNVDQNAHALVRWVRDFSDGSQLQALGYYDYSNLTTTDDGRIDNRGQLELEFQHRFQLGSLNEITYGGNYRKYSDQFLNPVNFYFSPQDQVLDIFGGYLQDRFTLMEGKLFLTGGVKLENNTYTGNEWQPSGRLLFTPDESNSFWGAVSKAVRIPVQVGRSADIYFAGIPQDAFGPGTPPVNTYGAFIPNPDLGSETLVSWECGYRTNPTDQTSLDLAGFYNHYDGLFRFFLTPGTYPSPAGGIIDSSVQVVQARNAGSGDIYGLELAAHWEPQSSFKVHLSYTYQDYDRGMVVASNLETGAPPPHHLANGRVYFDPFPDWELNSGVYFTDTTYLYDPLDNTRVVPAYWRWDLGATWKPEPGFRWSLWAVDLEGTHTETLPAAFISQAQVVPGFYGQLTLEY